MGCNDHHSKDGKDRFGDPIITSTGGYALSQFLQFKHYPDGSVWSGFPSSKPILVCTSEEIARQYCEFVREHGKVMGVVTGDDLELPDGTLVEIVHKDIYWGPWNGWEVDWRVVEYDGKSYALLRQHITFTLVYDAPFPFEWKRK